MIKKEVLHLGPDYRNHRGGMGAVLEVYSKYIPGFLFIPTYANRSFTGNIFLYIIAILKLISALISNRNIKIVHIHSSFKGSFIRKSLLLMISKLFRKKVILHIHASAFHLFYQNAGFLRSYIRFIISKADVVVCLSLKWKEFFETNFKLHRIEIIKNVTEAPNEGNARKTRNGHIHFLFLGAIGKRKGVFDLLEVLQNNEEEFRDKFKLTVAGDGEVKRLKKTIRENYPEGEVKYAGWVNDVNKTELLHNCDIYVLPSYNEGLPMSLLEAISYGKPVISTNVGGIPELVHPGLNGWLFEPGDHEALHGILKEAIADKTRLQEYGDYSRILSRQYQPDVVFKSLEDLYGQL